MPRFFFHIHYGAVHEIDSVGLEFASLEHAVLDARKAACEIVAENMGDAVTGWQRFEIAIANGEVVVVVPFYSALRLN